MGERRWRRREIESAEALREQLAGGQDLRGWVVQGVDLSQVEGLDRAAVAGAVFWACTGLSPGLGELLRERGAVLIPRIEGLPYDSGPTRLYDADALLAGFAAHGFEGAYDTSVYTHYHAERRHPGGMSLFESLAERLHDHAIEDALREFVEEHRGEGVVAVMGGHAEARASAVYAEVVRLGWELSRRGFLVTTGGGPGVMEAANFGAALGAVDEAMMQRAHARIAALPSYSTKLGPDELQGYIAGSLALRDELAPSATRPSLAIPTWFYGHEPSNVFATGIAKFFDNASREELVLALPERGIVFAPGSAGTMQEIFQDLAQNHYATYGSRSPMVFLGSAHWGELVGFIRCFVAAKGMQAAYGELIHLCDSASEAAAFIAAHPPRKA